MGCPPSHEEQSRMDRAREAHIKRAKETGEIHCDPSAAPTRAERGVIGPNEKKLITKRMAAVKNAPENAPDNEVIAAAILEKME